jgi:hypothetical protein
MRKVSKRIGENWLVLTHMSGRTYRLQVFGDTPLEAEVVAVDETEAKKSAVAATIERLNIERESERAQPLQNWNPVMTCRWDSRLAT